MWHNICITAVEWRNQWQTWIYTQAMKKWVFARGKGHKHVPAKTKRTTGHCSPCSVSAVVYINRHILLLLESKTSTNKQKKQLHLFIVFPCLLNALKARYDLPFNQSCLAAWLTITVTCGASLYLHSQDPGFSLSFCVYCENSQYMPSTITSHILLITRIPLLRPCDE